MMGELKENGANELQKKMVNLAIKEENIEVEFGKDYGERLHLAKGALLIQEIGNRLNCSLITVTKAMVMFHKVNKNEKFNISHLNSVASLHLAIKLCGESVTPDELVLISYHAILDMESNRPNPKRLKPSPEELNTLKKNLHLADCYICRSMNFVPQCPIAHAYIFKYLVQLQSATDASTSFILTTSSTITKLLSTFYMCAGCLDYTAEEIAAACLQFVYLYSGSVSPSVRVILKKEIFAIPDKDKIGQILDEMILVSDVATTLKYI